MVVVVPIDALKPDTIRLALAFKTTSGTPEGPWHPRLAVAPQTGLGTDWEAKYQSESLEPLSNYKVD